ncbi:hypothetical protein ACJMK2_024614 [Sinanodonta woodiana]|uniref:Palmitoyltransferase n=1 Tax=Sinanodonta woodiana TaxID=1069815 RepID=A0ABD3XFE9_SINWO
MPSQKPFRRWELPKSQTDKLGLCVFVIGGIFLLWYEALHILPTYYPDESSIMKYVHYFAAFVFAFNIYGNMFFLITTDISGRHLLFPSGPSQDGWKYCEKSQCNIPARAHYCKLCQIPVLRRDHHCWFAGYCVGYHNHRYYIAMVTYITLAALYCNIFNASFVFQVKNGITFWNLLSFIGPQFGLLFGYLTWYEFFITLLSSIGFILLLLFSWLLEIQIVQIFSGQTRYERKMNIRDYNMGLKQNIAELLGPRWYLVFLSPWIPCELPGDGLSFPSKGK